MWYPSHMINQCLLLLVSCLPYSWGLQKSFSWQTRARARGSFHGEMFAFYRWPLGKKTGEERPNDDDFICMFVYLNGSILAQWIGSVVGRLVVVIATRTVYASRVQLKRYRAIGMYENLLSIERSPGKKCSLGKISFFFKSSFNISPGYLDQKINNFLKKLIFMGNISKIKKKSM